LNYTRIKKLESIYIQGIRKTHLTQCALYHILV